MTRRDLLTFALWTAAAAPFRGLAAPERRPDALLVILDLVGGNDGLDTVIPWGDPAYPQLRPSLGWRAEETLPLADGLGLHPALAEVLPLWERGELAVILGVGHDAPSLSHFTSIDIWDQARLDPRGGPGWLGRALASHPAEASAAADAIAVGTRAVGDLSGPGVGVLTLDGRRPMRPSGDLPPAADASNPALRHLLAVEADLDHAAHTLPKPRRLSTRFPDTPLGRDLEQVVQLAAGGASPVFKVALGGFDTHARQRPRREQLLAQLGGGLTALEAGLREIGRWGDTIVMTRSEFGRRPAENASGGTDHGTASVLFVTGGRARGGVAGAWSSLADLEDGNLRAVVDFRAVYGTVLARGLGVDPGLVLGERLPLLDVLV